MKTNTPTTEHPPTALLDTQQAAEAIGLRPQTLHEWRTRRVGPSYLKLGRSVRYRASDLREWMEAQRVLCD